MYIYIYIYTYIYVCVCVCVRVFVCVFVCVCVFMHVCVYVSICKYYLFYFYLFIYMYKYSYVCMYIYVYIHFIGGFSCFICALRTSAGLREAAPARSLAGTVRARAARQVSSGPPYIYVSINTTCIPEHTVYTHHIKCVLSCGPVSGGNSTCVRCTTGELRPAVHIHLNKHDMYT